MIELEFSFPHGGYGAAPVRGDTASVNIQAGESAPEVHERAIPAPYRPAVVAPPHPLYGGRMDNPVVTTMARALAQCGYVPLLFNWRGVGRSQGSASGRLEHAEEDYRTALEKVLEPAANAGVLAAGYSFGAVAALRLAAIEESHITRLVLVAPPVQMIEAIDIASVVLPIQVLVGDADQYASIDQLSDALAPAREARLDVIPDADHFFGFPPSLDKLAELICVAQ